MLSVDTVTRVNGTSSSQKANPVAPKAAQGVFVGEGQDTTGKLYVHLTAVPIGEAVMQVSVSFDGLNPPGPYYFVVGGSGGGVYVGGGRIAENAYVKCTLLTNAQHGDLTLTIDPNGQTSRYRFSLPLAG